jgi:hypothetical protein
MIGVNLWSCANDIPAGFFVFLAFAHALRARGGSGRLPFFLTGIFFGAAVSVKVTALLAGPFFMLWLTKASLRGAVPATKQSLPSNEGVATAQTPGLAMTGGAFALFGLGLLLPLLPWWVRTGMWTGGNPFFPHAAGILGGDSVENLSLLAVWNRDAAGEGGMLFRALSLARESLQGMEQGRFGFVGPALLMLLPLAFFLRPDPVWGPMTAYAVLSYAAFVTATGRLRYYIPHLPVLFALAAACLSDYARGVSSLPQKTLARLGPALRVMAGAAVALNLLWLTLVFQRFNQGWPVIWGRQSPRDYLLVEHIGTYGHPSQAAFDWLRDNGAVGRLFMVGEARTFRSPLPASASGNFNVPGYARHAGDPPSPEALLENLRREGFTYILVNVAEMKRITPEPYKQAPYLKALGGLFDRLPPPLYRDQWCLLFAIPGEKT